MTSNTVTVKITEKYLRFPVSFTSPINKINLYCNGCIFDEIDLRLNEEAFTFYAYYDASEYLGREIVIELPEYTSYSPVLSAERDYGFESVRPYIHFTPTFGWMNDPNGLVSYTSPVTGETVYHMFYQHNPYDPAGFGDMHWGHAISYDLFHWEDLDTAIRPDESGFIASGGAIIDTKNVSGIKDGEENVMMLFYTANPMVLFERLMSNGRPATQNLAYSTDGGKTFKKYKNNPIIQNITQGNRDPKVIWCEELSCYVMIFFLIGHEYAIYTSNNLLDWAHLQTITIENEWECPDIFPICVDGNSDDRKWVIVGSDDIYVICECRDGLFHIIQEPKRMTRGACSASQTFTGAADNRYISLAWEHNVPCARPSSYCGQMTTPVELSLKLSENGYFLCATPAREIANLITKTDEYTMIKLGGEDDFSITVNNAAYMVTLDLSEIGDSKIEFEFWGNKTTIDPLANQMQSGAEMYTAPLWPCRGTRKLCLIFDRFGMEAFAGDGESYMVVPINYIEGENTLCLRGDGEAVIKSMVVSELHL